MDIIIRKIETREGGVIFKPKGKSGYRFDCGYAQPALTEFQRACISTSSQRNKRLGNFWTPNFCYIGSMLVAHEEVQLLSKSSYIENTCINEFNANFLDRKNYWYKKPKPENQAVETYFTGVRVVASILAHYYKLKEIGRIKEAKILYSNYLFPLGITSLLSRADSSLLTDDDSIYSVMLLDDRCTISTPNYSPSIVKESIRSNSQATHDNTKSEAKTEKTYKKEHTNSHSKESVSNKKMIPDRARISRASDRAVDENTIATNINNEHETLLSAGE